MNIDDIRIGERYRKDIGDISSLAASIQEIGLLHPVVVTPDGELIAGQRRLAAVRKLGWADVPVTTVDLDQVVRGEYAENVYRKDFTPTEAVSIGRLLEEREQEKAKERMVEAHASPGNLPELEQGNTRDKVGAYVGMSGKTYEKAKAVVEAAEAEPELFGDLPELMDEKSVDKAYKEKRQRERIASERVSVAVLPTNISVVCGNMEEELPGLGLFDLAIVDPPYNVTDWDWDRFDSPDDFLAQTTVWLTAVKLALKPLYHLFWFCSPRYMAPMEELFFELDLPIKSRIVWHRRNMALGSDAKDKFIDSWECILHSGTRPLNWPAQWDDSRFDVQTFAVPQTNFGDRKLHPTQKPLALIEWLVRYGSCPGDRVLDPFAGAGTTGAACPGRECVLVEQSASYVEAIYGRLGLRE